MIETAAIQRFVSYRNEVNYNNNAFYTDTILALDLGLMAYHLDINSRLENLHSMSIQSLAFKSKRFSYHTWVNFCVTNQKMEINLLLRNLR